ncbi:MAG: GxxExxY protein [Chitinophagaceae bacterium]|nr:GxxExxY protein [Chitinophagaceae bacterium]MBK8952798.1 GxxExxY protein [Chitinophagaceae bacterium]
MPYQEIPSSLNRLSQDVIGLAIKVHKNLGPGLLESSYRECLFYEIAKAGYFVEKEKALPLFYETIKLDAGYRIDIHVEKEMIIEIKAVESLTDVHTAQLLTYMKLSENRLGLLINFNVTLLKNGIKRLVL